MPSGVYKRTAEMRNKNQIFVILLIFIGILLIVTSHFLTDIYVQSNEYNTLVDRMNDQYNARLKYRYVYFFDILVNVGVLINVTLYGGFICFFISIILIKNKLK